MFSPVSLIHLHGLLELRNTPKGDGISPAQALYGKPLRSLLPDTNTLLFPTWINNQDAKRKKLLRDAVYYNVHTRQLKPLSVHQCVKVQDINTKRWSSRGVITKLLPHRSYIIRLDSGQIIRRNRYHLRPHGGGGGDVGRADADGNPGRKK